MHPQLILLIANAVIFGLGVLFVRLGMRAMRLDAERIWNLNEKD